MRFNTNRKQDESKASSSSRSFWIQLVQNTMEVKIEVN